MKGGHHDCTWSEKYRQAKVNCLKSRCLLLVCKQEVLRFEVPVHHSMLVAHLTLYRLKWKHKLS
jgi:hypothetical protein